MKHLSLSKQLLVLSGAPMIALLVFSAVLCQHALSTWFGVAQTAAVERLITAVKDYAIAIPREGIVSLDSQESGSAELRAQIPERRMRTDAALATLRQEAERAGLTDPYALERLRSALSVDLSGNRSRVDAGRQTQPDILATLRPATRDAIDVVGRLAVVATDADVSRLVQAYAVGLNIYEAILMQRYVRPLTGTDDESRQGIVAAERVGVGEQDVLTLQFERLVPKDVLPRWREFLTDASALEVGELRRVLLGLGAGEVLDADLVERWYAAIDDRLHLLEPVLASISSALQRVVAQIETSASISLFNNALLVLATFGTVPALVWRIRRRLSGRISRLSLTMRQLADGALDVAMPEGGAPDELGEMERTLAIFRASLVERRRLAREQEESTAALLNEKERLRVTLHAIGDGVVVTNPMDRVTMMNDAAETLTGHSIGEALDAPIDRVLTVVSGNGTDNTLVRRDGSEIAVDITAAEISGRDGTHIGTVTVLHDVTESRRLLERIRQLAHYDPLTGLPNRSLLHDRLRQALAQAQRRGTGCALLFLDMDRFKQVNDTLGHAVGDMLLREVGQRLLSIVRHSDSVARLGGDEFVVVLSDIAEGAFAAQVAREILQAIGRIDRIGGHDVDVSFSIGIALYPHDADTVDGLLMRADAAMYQAKEAGRNDLSFFDPEMDRATQQRVQTRLALSRALALRQMRLLYQPKVDLRSGRIIGVEALIRWQREPGSLLAPADFIGVAEESGLIQSIDFWVVREACRQSRAWRDAGLPPLTVSVNVSMRSLHAEGLLETIRAALDEAGLPASSLEIEVTESAAMNDPFRTQDVLRSIRALGVQVSMDDFGTGFSSLSQLRLLPVDTIKIDRAFVSTMVEVEEDAELVRAIVEIAATMRKHVVAEGVETRGQRDVLLRLGCQEAQGYLFSHPIEPDALADMVRLRSSPSADRTASGEPASRDREAILKIKPGPAVLQVR